MFSSAKKGTMKGRGKRGKREEKSERARGKGKKKGKKGGEGEEKEKKMEEISLNGGEGFQEASWGVGNVFKKIEEYTPLDFMPGAVQGPPQLSVVLVLPPNVFIFVLFEKIFYQILFIQKYNNKIQCVCG